MGDRTKIEWTDSSWNPIRARWFAPQSDGSGKERVGWHCEHVSEGCRNCYAESINMRLGTGLPFKPDHLRREVRIPPNDPNGALEWRGDVTVFLDEKMLLQPLRWRRPRMIFVGSMTDLFADFVTDDMLDRVFAVMALCPQHTFQVLTKRPARMRAYCNDVTTPHRIAKATDAIIVDREIAAMAAEEVRPITEYPGYFVSDRGRILSSSGSGRCLYCGGEVLGIATKAYCSQKCRQNACYVRRTGRATEGERTLAAMSPDVGEQGHLRVTLYKNGEPCRELVHRLVLTTFVRCAEDGEQGCHRNGDPSLNALPNLRWSDQAGNWTDSKRHGSARRYRKLDADDVAKIRRGAETVAQLASRFDVSETQIRNIASGKQWANVAPIAWPLPAVWLGTSCEDQATADARIPELLFTPAAVRFVSAEPLLAPITFRTEWLIEDVAPGQPWPCLRWAIVGGESGPGARPMHPAWARAIREQCAAAGVAFHFKQWGEWRPQDDSYCGVTEANGSGSPDVAWPDGTIAWGTADAHGGVGLSLWRVGKKRSGRLLDGIEHNGFPASIVPRATA